MADDVLNKEIIKQHRAAAGRNISPSSLQLFSRLKREILEIRVLTLCPGAWETPITCNLHKYELNDTPPFTALSYQWGDPREQKLISIDGVQRTIRSNLESALRHIRHFQYPINLWIDAICL
jgi:hypothetical protein